LTSILETFEDLLVHEHDHDNDNDNDQILKRAVGDYFAVLRRVPRFDTLTLFLSPSEEQRLKNVQKLLEA
jgi:SpoVK/Ycf46/Vps4 family AAA+-type ATPase